MKKMQHDDLNPLDASILKDQRSTYVERRERCPSAHSEFMGWSLVRHEDMATILADPETFSNILRLLAVPNGMDSPAHGRHREALEPNFDQEKRGSQRFLK